MSDGQSFYLLLALFYLAECFSTSPEGSLAIKKNLFRGWSLGHPLTYLGGLRKSLFLAHLLPFPQSTLISSPPSSEQKPILNPRHARRLLKLTQLALLDLRLLSLMVAISFFGTIPYIYMRDSDGPRTLLAIGFAFLFMLMASIRFFALHRRYYRTGLGDRLKHCFFCLFLPWHAMRISDYIMQTPRMTRIHPLALSLCTKDSSHFLSEWRKAKYELSPYSFETVTRIAKHAGFTEEDLLAYPTADSPESTQYCPCCHETLNESVSSCAECNGIKLLPLPPRKEV